jgi:hypothetical protein
LDGGKMRSSTYPSWEDSPMYQLRNTVTVRYGKFREYHAAMEQLNEIARQRGWVEAKRFVPVAGVDNQYVRQWEYESLADFERETESFYTDAEAMKVFRDAAELVIEGSSTSELLVSAPAIA